MILSLVPIFIYLLIVKILDNFSIVKWKMMAICGLGGIWASIISLLIAEIPENVPEWAFPLLEEIVKGTVVVALISRHKIVFFIEALCYGAAVGAGFAIWENLSYAFFNTDMTALLFAYRGFGTALMHMGCSAVLATMALSMNRFLAVIPAAAIHCLYNMFLLPVFAQLIVTMMVFIGVFAAIGYYDERRVYRWMDFSITDDVALLVAIHEGKLTDTAAGQYLMKIQNHFPAEVFFDMICYVQLYLEIIIKGKSRILLDQVGMLEPLTAEERDNDIAMKTELKTLQKNIGPLGIQLLRPILRYNAEDLKVLDCGGTDNKRGGEKGAGRTISSCR